MRRLFICFSFVLGCLSAYAQTSADLETLKNAKWETTVTPEGLVHKRAAIADLYGGPQHINLVEIPSGAKVHYGIAVSEMKKASLISKENQALASINGSYYNMEVGNSVCFLKVGKEVLDTTGTNELNMRVTGAVHVHKGKCRIMPWSHKIEKTYKSNKGTVLASGPLMLEDGELYSWENCDNSFIVTKHPRSAIYTTKDGKTVFLTVDGRSRGNAIGVSIPELAHLISALGGEDALNLDGGGSTTLWMEGAPDNGVLNCPSDNRTFDHAGERRIPNIIYVHRR